MQQEHTELPKRTKFVSAGIVLLLVLLHLTGGGSFWSSRNRALTASGALGVDEQDSPFGQLSLEAQSVYVFDLVSQQELFSRHADRRLPLASLAKLMTALIVRQRLGGEAEVVISADAVHQDGDDGLLVGERFTARDLTKIMLAASSNDAAYALAEAVDKVPRQNSSTDAVQDIASAETAGSASSLGPFVALMNQTAEQLGFAHMEFLNPTGLDVSDVLSGAYGTARDLAKLAIQVVAEDSELIELTRSATFHAASRNGREHRFKNTNKILSQIPGIIGAKTGFTDLAGGNLLVLFDVGVHHPVIAVVLGSSIEGRFTDMMQLVNATYAFFAR